MTEIAIIGPRGVGKTTYLATLATFPHKNRFPGWQINSRTRASEELVAAAENILKQGNRLEPTELEPTENEYEFEITIPATKNISGAKLELFIIEYAGEIFENLAQPYRWDGVKDYVEDFLKTQGLKLR